MARDLTEIQKEFQQLAFKAGNLQYQIAQNSKDLENLNKAMSDLNLEFVAAQGEAAKAQQAAEKTESGAV